MPDTVGCAKVGFDHSARLGGPGLGNRLIILVAALRTAYQFLFTTFKALLSSYGIKEPSFRAIICEKRNLRLLAVRSRRPGRIPFARMRAGPGHK